MENTFFMCINILIALFIWYKIWHKICIYECRHSLFQVRDDLRTYFIGHNIALNTESYKFARDCINTHIRYAENASLLKATILTVLLRKSFVDSSVSERLTELPTQQQTEVWLILNKSVDNLMTYMVKKSFVCYFLLLPIFARNKVATRHTKDVVKTDIRVFSDTEAMFAKA